MKKLLLGTLLACACTTIFAGDIPAQFQGEWGVNGTSGCSDSDTSNLVTIDAKVIAQSYGTYTLKGHDKTSMSGTFSANFKYEGDEEEGSEDSTVTLRLTDKGKLLMNDEQLFSKCEDYEVAQRKQAAKTAQLKQDMIGVWSDVDSGALYSFFYREEDVLDVLIDNEGPYQFNVDSVDSKTDSVTIAQDAKISNHVWTMKIGGSEDNRYATLVTSGAARHKLAYVRDISDADRRQLTAVYAKNNKPQKKGKTAWLISPPTNIRTEPAGEVICVMRERQEINILGAKAADDGTVWYKTDACGKTGFVSTSQLKF